RRTAGTRRSWIGAVSRAAGDARPIDRFSGNETGKRLRVPLLRGCDVESYHVEPVVQVREKVATLHETEKLCRRRGDNLHVRAVIEVVEPAKQLTLLLTIQPGNLHQNQRPFQWLRKRCADLRPEEADGLLELRRQRRKRFVNSFWRSREQHVRTCLHQRFPLGPQLRGDTIRDSLSSDVGRANGVRCPGGRRTPSAEIHGGGTLSSAEVKC